MRQLNYDFNEIYPCNETLLDYIDDLDLKIKRRPHFVQEIETILGFMKNMNICMNSFKNNLLDSCSKFQQDINKQLKYEFSMKYFQIVMNGFLKFHHKIESYMTSLSQSQKQLKQLKEDFEKEKFKLHVKDDRIKKLRIYKDNYNRATDEYLQLFENTSKEDEENSKQLEIKENISKNLFKDFTQQTKNVTQNLFSSLENLLKLERKSRETSIEMLIDITTLFSDKDFTIIDQFDYLKKNLSKTPLDLIDQQNQIRNFLKVENSFDLEQPLYVQKALDKYYISYLEIQKYLKEKMDENIVNITQPDIYYIRTQIQMFYQNKKNQVLVFTEVTKKLLQKNPSCKRFFFLLLIDQKSHMTYMSPFSRYNIKEHQVLLLQEIFEFLFTKQNQKDLDNELNFLLIRVFKSFHYNDVQSFALFKNCPVLSMPNFWINYYNQSIKINKQYEQWERNLQGLQKKGSFQFLDTISNFWSNKKEVQLSDRILKQILDLLLKIPMKVDNFFTILQKLTQEIAQKQDLIQDFLNKKHKKILLNVEKEIIDKENMKIKKYNHITKNEKLKIIIKNIAQYFVDSKVLLYMSILNRSIKLELLNFAKQQVLLNNIQNNNLRKQIFLSFINSDYQQLKLKQIQDSKSEKIIHLDIQRTLDYRINKKGKRLQYILVNICDENSGNFNYFQGLNYLSNYFFLLFEEDEFQTFNFMIFLMKQNYFLYTQKDFQNMKILFYIQTKLIERYLPQIYKHFNKIDLNCDIFLPGWYLTVFTTILHQQKSSQLLDDIVDIFVSEGWKGFFKIVLIILENCQQIIVQKDQDDCMIYFSEMNKKGFTDLEQKFSTISIKDQIKKFDQISQQEISYFTNIYDQVATNLKKLKKKFNFQKQQLTNQIYLTVNNVKNNYIYIMFTFKGKMSRRV